MGAHHIKDLVSCDRRERVSACRDCAFIWKEFVEFCFEIAAQGTPAARAVLDIRETAGEELNVKSIDLED